MAGRKVQINRLFACAFICLSLIAAVEYFKYATRINYEWFHCTPTIERIGTAESSVIMLSSRGGPSCDKRGEFKTIVKRISRDFEPNSEHLSFCIKENLDIPPVHYPIGENKGAPGYIAYAGYDRDYQLVKEMCADSPMYHF